jgi:hypothetical protein
MCICRYSLFKMIKEAHFPKPQYVGDCGLIYPYKLYKNPFTSKAGCYNLRGIVLCLNWFFFKGLLEFQ